MTDEIAREAGRFLAGERVWSGQMWETMARFGNGVALFARIPAESQAQAKARAAAVFAWLKRHDAQPEVVNAWLEHVGRDAGTRPL